MQNVEGKIAFITGGASGLGLAMARSFSAAGMKVVIADIEQSALDVAVASFSDSNAEVLGIQLDVTDRIAMQAAADQTEAEFGKIHVVCNNAGVAVGGAIDKMSFEDWDWVMKVNVDGVINGVQTFLPRILAHGEGGHIVNTASMAGHMPVPRLSVYNTGKFAVVGMSEVMRLDLAESDIGVSVLCPGVVTTNIFSSGRNRPDQLQSETDTASDLLKPDHRSEEERLAAVESIFAGALDPQVLGDMVLHAIVTDEFYIFSHPELRTSVAARNEDMMGSFDRWTEYRHKHDI